MGKLSVDDKILRVSRFLAGLRSRRIAELLRPYGFEAQTRREGWTLVAKAAGAELDFQAPPASPALFDDTIERLDRFENRWFPIAQATLMRHRPEAATALFRNLRQTEGIAVVLSVGTFVERLEATDPDTRALLASRGLSEAVLTDVKALLTRARGASSAPTDADLGVSDAAERDAIDAAVAAMWDWYREWSTIARAVITNKRYLRLLGFGGKPNKRTTADTSGPTPEQP